MLSEIISKTKAASFLCKYYKIIFSILEIYFHPSKKNIIFKSTTKSTPKFLHFFFFFFLFFLFICVQLNNKNRRFPNHLHHFVGNTHNCTQRSLSPYNPLTCSSSYHFPHFLSQTPFNLISSSSSHLPMILLIINICQSPTIIF